MKLKTKVFNQRLGKDNNHVYLVVLDMNSKKIEDKKFNLDCGFVVTTGDTTNFDLENKVITFNNYKNESEMMPLIFDFKVDDMKATVKLLKEAVKEIKKIK